MQYDIQKKRELYSPGGQSCPGGRNLSMKSRMSSHISGKFAAVTEKEGAGGIPERGGKGWKIPNVKLYRAYIQ